MVDRVVLGEGRLLRRVTEALADRPGSLFVVTGDGELADDLGETGAAVREGDPADRTLLGEATAAASVLVAAESVDRAVAIARAARSAFPEASIVAVAGTDGAASPELSAVADRVVDPPRVAADYLMERVGHEGIRMRQLSRILRELDSLAVVMHDNPDPDAIASAVALQRIAEGAGCDVEICYYGSISHQENRAFINLLEFELRNLAPGESPEAEGIALIDHSRPGVNDGLPSDFEVDIVIDHHPPREPVEARFVDLRSGVGATSTLLVDYLSRFDIGFDTTVATALLFGIRIDTDEFTREVCAQDFEAAARLVEHADLETLDRIESPSVSPETFDTLAGAIRNRQRFGQVVLTSVGRFSDRDALAQAADRLVMIQEVGIAVVYGVDEDTIYLSARARGTPVDLGEVLREAYGAIGSAGGHADMAGAQITLGVLEAVEEREESLLEIVETVVSSRFREALASNTDPPVLGTAADATGTGSDSADEYLELEEFDPDRGTEETDR